MIDYSWRPPDWQDLKKKAVDKFCAGWRGERAIAEDAIEAGASAMLEGYQQYHTGSMKR